MGMEQLAREVSRLDPYTITLEGLREKIIEAALPRPRSSKTPGVVKGLRKSS